MAEFIPDTIKLQGKDYLEVAQRVLWLRTEHPDAQIVTDVVEHDRAEGWVLMKATVTIPGTNGLATGYGTASRKDLRGPVAAAYLEKAETRAIGRACAGLGYGTLAAMQEDSDTLADAPVERKAAPAPMNAAPVAKPAPSPALETAITAWRKAMAERGITDKAEQDRWAKAHSRGRGLATLTVQDWDVLMATALALPGGDGPTRDWARPAPVEAP